MTNYSYGSSNAPGWYNSKSLIVEVRIGEGVTSVGDYAFYDHDNLVDVTLPLSLERIGNSAFYSCGGLTTLTLPDNLTTIGGNSFERSNLTEITIPASVTTLGISAFRGCSALRNITFLGNNITELPNYVFHNCSKLQDITIPNGVTRIGNYAFNGCTALTVMTVPEGVTSIGNDAFVNCTEMLAFYLPASLQEIGNYCFGSISGVDLHFAGTMQQWVAANTNNGTKYQAFCSDDTIRTWGNYGENHTYTLTVDGLLTLSGSGPVTDFSDKVNPSWNGWWGSFVTVVLPEGIPNIGRRMFEGCSNLETIVIPASVTTIGEKAFTNCSKLNITYEGTMEQWLALSPDNTTVSSIICTDQTLLRNGSCGDNVRYMLTGDGQMTITGTGAMTDYTDYRSMPWYSCREQIRSVSIDSGVTGIGSYSFYGCANLETITMAGSITVIGSYAFYNCDAVTHVTIPDSVTTIGSYAFSYCDNLNEINIPASVTTIGAYAFHSCSNLARVHIEDLGAWCGINFGNNSANPAGYAGGFYLDGELVEKAIIPAGTAAINDHAFYGCTALTELTVPASVASIGETAFYNCNNLKQIHYGDTFRRWLALYPDNTSRTVSCTDDRILYSDKCGDAAHCIVLESGRLEINGSGVTTSRPWNNYYDVITEAIIAPGITEIRDYMFSYLYHLTSISIPQSVVSIGHQSFYNCSSLEEITIPASVQTIGNQVFANCNALKSINFEHTASDPISIGTQAFYFSGDTGSSNVIATAVGVPYSRVINEAIRNYNWVSCRRRPEYYSTRVLPAEAIEIESVEGITVIEAGLDICLKVNFTPAESTSQIIWSILEEESTGTATINEYGVLTTLTPGIVTVQAQTDDSGVTDEIAITVNRPTAEAEFVEVYVADYDFNEAAVGSTVQMIADVLPGNTADKHVLWSVEDGTGTATIDENGRLTALSTGTVTVYAEAVNGVKGSCVVSIMRYVEDFDFTFSGEETTRTYAVGERVHIAAISTPADASEPYPNWEIRGGTANVNFRSWNYGTEITGLTSGTVTVAARSRDSKGYETTFELHFDEDLRGEYALPNGAKLLYNKQTGTIIGVEGTLGAVTIPGKIGDTVITAIAPYAFTTRSGSSANGNSSLTSVVIPASVESIGDFAFAYCNNLTSVRFEEGSMLKSIGAAAFCDCNALATMIYTGTQLKTIGEGAFYDCDVFPGMTLPAGIEKIDPRAFAWCGNFASLTIPEGLTDIGEQAFYGLGGLKKLTMRGDLDGRGWLDWYEVDQLTLTGETVIGFVQEGDDWIRLPGRNAKHVILADTITRIEEDAFADYDALTTVTFSSNLKHIETGAFRGCRNLTAAELPEGLETLGDYAFAVCENLTVLNIPQSLTSIGHRCFAGTHKLQLLDLSAVPDVLQGTLELTNLAVVPEWLVRCASEQMELYWYMETVEGQMQWHDIVDWYGRNGSEYLEAKATGYVRLFLTDEYTGISSSKEIFVQPGLQIFSDRGNKMSADEGMQLYLIKPNGDPVAAYWSLRSNDLRYASIDDDGFLQAKTVDAVREIQVTATPRDGGDSVSMTIYITPKTTKLVLWSEGSILGKTGKSVQTLQLDMLQQSQMQLTVTDELTDFSPAVQWSSSASAVVQVDGDGMLTFLKPGTATITATAVGTSVSVSVKFDVIFLEATKKLTASAATPVAGLQSGQSVQMQIFGADKTVPLDSSYFKYSIPAEQQAIATVDADGLITAGNTAGTVTVTASLAGDPLGRTATVKVKVITPQAERLELDPVPIPNTELQKLDENGSQWLLILDAADLETGICFGMDLVGYDYNGREIFPAVKWATTDKKVATVQTDANGNIFVNVMPNASGSCVLQAKASDLIGATAELTIQIRDYTPRLESDTFTLNSFQGGIASTALVEVHGNAIQEAKLLVQSKSGQWTESSELQATVEQGRLTITANDVLTAGKRQMQLQLLCDRGVYTYPITVTIANTLPSVTVKQNAKFNLFYTDSEVPFTITAKNAVVTDVRLVNSPDFTLEVEDGIPVLRYSEQFLENPSTAVTKKVTLEVSLEGYAVPVTKTITISTTNTKPKLTMDPASSIIHPQASDIPATLVNIYDATAGQWLDLVDCVQNVDADFATADVTGDGLWLTLTGKSGGTATITVQADGWTQSVALKHKITVQDKDPTVKLASSSLKLNRILVENTASTKVILSHSNLELFDVEIVSAAAEGTAVRDEADKLYVYYEDGYIYAEIADPDDAPKAATYTFYCTGILPNGQELARVKLSVGVGSTAPKVKLKQSTLNLNKCLANTEVISSAVTVTGATGYVLTGFELAGNEIDGLSLYLEDGLLKVELIDDTITSKSYKLKLIPVMEHEESQHSFTLSSTISLTVKVYNSSKYAVTLSAKGKLDTLNPDSAILYTITKMSNISGEVDGVSLAGADAQLFHAELVEDSDKPQVKLSLLPGQEYSTSKTYKVNLKLLICGQDVQSKELSFRVTQSKMKVTAPKEVTYYLSQTVPLEVPLQATAPAEIFHVALGSKTDPALQEIIEDLTLTEDGRVLLTVGNATQLVKGKRYALTLEVTPVNNASNVAPTLVSVNVKVSN